MGLSNRLRERREQLGLTQSEVATLLGITPGAVGNYENGVSTPKADILFKVFDALKCDANYLFQDEMKKIAEADKATPDEMDKLVKKYRKLDAYGKETVNILVDREYQRCIDYEMFIGDKKFFIDGKTPPNLAALSNYAQQFNKELNAAHARTDIEVTAANLKHDDDIMDDENF